MVSFLFQSAGRLSNRPPRSSAGRQGCPSSARTGRILSSMGRRGHNRGSRAPGAPGLAPTLGPLGWASGPLLPTPQEPGGTFGKAAKLAVPQRTRRVLQQVGLMMADKWCKLRWLIDLHNVSFQPEVTATLSSPRRVELAVNHRGPTTVETACHSGRPLLCGAIFHGVLTNTFDFILQRWSLQTACPWLPGVP